MPISSLIVRTNAEDSGSVVKAIEAVDGTAVLHVEDGAIAVLTETTSEEADQQLFHHIETIHSVIAVELIYHNFEDIEAG